MPKDISLSCYKRGVYMITLKNESLTVSIAEMGAEIRSIVCDGTEYMWHADPAVWAGSAPIMFPICGGLKDDRYTLNGKEYSLIKHGFARVSMFSVEEQSDTRAVFLLKATEETKRSYPFDFELRAIFEIEGKAVKIDYRVDNRGENTMYFNIGAHEAYVTPEGIEDYDIVFDAPQTLNAHNLYGYLLAEDTYPIIKDSAVLPLYDKYFIIDALPFTEVTAGAATLRNRKTGRAVRVDFPDATNLLLWHKHGSGYMCVEPWNGIPDMPGSSYDITEKKGISVLEPGKTFSFRHTVTVME